MPNNIRKASLRTLVIEASKFKQLQGIEMAEAGQKFVESTSKKARKSYSREEKLKKYYYDNGKISTMCKRYLMNSKSVMRWMKDEEKIRGSSKGAK